MKVLIILAVVVVCRAAHLHEHPIISSRLSYSFVDNQGFDERGISRGQYNREGSSFGLSEEPLQRSLHEERNSRDAASSALDRNINQRLVNPPMYTIAAPLPLNVRYNYLSHYVHAIPGSVYYPVY